MSKYNYIEKNLLSVVMFLNFHRLSVQEQKYLMQPRFELK